MDDLSRYSCQVALKGFGKKAQEKLKKAKVLIVGMGGLGCPLGQYLVSTGVGMVGIADYDTVSLKNLHRQILFSEKDVGKKKVDVAAKRLKSQNPQTEIVCHPYKITSENVLPLIKKYDIVVDCTDNFETRYLLTDASVLLKKPLVYGSIFQFEGQVSVFNVKNNNGTYSPNYRDIFSENNNVLIPNCDEGGVIPTIAGIIGIVQANEVIKYITGIGELLVSKLFIFNAKEAKSTIVNLPAVTKVEIQAIKRETVPLMTIAEFKNSMKKKEFESIDVRTHEEHNVFNIGGENIPLEILPDKLHSLNLEKPIVFYCRSGRRSGIAVQQVLKFNQNARVYSLEGGVNAWSED